jgi:acyl-CoA synthetase (AMP-forming)/AMP-acid ligase II
VPVQYQRLMNESAFDDFDLSSYRMKFCTSAPFPAALKREVVARWPGGLLESYGMTEGGAVSFLPAHERPDKLHTVGRPAEGHEMRLIDDDGCELPAGATGEVVGRSAAMMSGYLNRAAESAAIIWTSPDGKRFIRTGDIGRFDDEGFLTLVDRKKDMINSGGFNVYPSDLESELRRHEAVAESAVVGVPSELWGETPVAFVVLRDGADADGDEIKAWLDARVSTTQRLHALQIVGRLPRSEIGKVLKRELRDAWLAGSGLFGSGGE